MRDFEKFVERRQKNRVLALEGRRFFVQIAQPLVAYLRGRGVHLEKNQADEIGRRLTNFEKYIIIKVVLIP